MTQARQKASLQQRRTAEWVDQSPLWTHGGAMEPWPERSLRFGRTKKIGEVMKRTKKRRKMVVEEKKDKSSDQNKKLDRRREKKRDRKLYPLRGRAGGSEGEGLSCHVILTRLEESQGDSERKTRKDGQHRHLSLKRRGRKSKKDVKTLSKHKSKSNNASIADYMHVLLPRKRRLASLNAEAVNSLLLERPWDTQPAAKQARKQDEAVTVGGAAEGDATTKTTTKTNTPGHSNKVTLGPKMCQKFKAKKVKVKAKVKSNPFELSQESLDAPAPRRLAGLNAAALLKLTSTSATAKQRVKSTPTSTTTTTTTTATSSDCKTQAPTTIKQHARVKYKGRPPKHKGKRGLASQLSCSACKKKSDFEPKVEWDSNGCTHRLTKPGYQSRSMMSYPLKQVKEEQMEAELSPYYCCPPKGSVEYCHRLAFFLGQQPYSESNNQQLKSALTPVKRECLVPSPSLTHSHPHTALTLSPHPCLCTAEHCFSSYYVHITHPPHTGTTSPTMASRSLNFSPSGLCSGQMSGSKGGSGLTHPAYCNSVGAPCFGEACRMGGCTFRAMPPVTSRGCTFSAGCTGCTHNIKTENYSSPQADPSLMVSSSLPISTCPLSTPPTSTQNTKPQLMPPQPPARLKLAKECPQPAKTPTKSPTKSSTKTANGSLSMGRTRLSQKQPPPPAPTLSSTKQKRVSRRRATNGWRPVGVPTEKEVFIAGEDETALRQCYEGVERDGEVIRVRDTVLLRSGPRKKSLPYVAKISALWEDPKSGELMMSLFWYYRPEHTQGGRDPSAHCENEIFASRHQDENSVACIEDRCYVLPLAQYCRFCALVKRRAEGAPPGCRGRLVPSRPDFAPPTHRCVPSDIDPDLVYLCRHVYDFRYGRILKNLQ